MEEHSYFTQKEKLEHIEKHYELLFSANNRLRQQAFILKGWCITLLMAYTGFAFRTSGIPLNLILPVIIIFSFYGLEVILQANVRRIKEHVKEIDKIFVIKCEQEFHNAVSDYLFTSLQYKQGFWGRLESFWGRVKNFFWAGLTYYVLGSYLLIFIFYYIIYRLIS